MIRVNSRNYIEKTELFNKYPLIIPPSWNKTQYQNELEIKNVWRQAAKEFEDAKNIYIIGFSLPETDSFFKYLYSLGSISPTRIRKLCVVNPDKTTEKSFKSILGPQVEDNFEFLNYSFKEFNRIEIDFDMI